MTRKLLKQSDILKLTRKIVEHTENQCVITMECRIFSGSIKGDQRVQWEFYANDTWEYFPTWDKLVARAMEVLNG